MISFRRQTLLLLMGALLVFSACHRTNKPWSEINTSQYVRPDVVIHRYELDLFQVPRDRLAEGLERLAPKYPLFIGENYRSEQSLIQMGDYLNDPLINQGYDAVDKTFADMTGCEKDLSSAFQRLQAVIPGFRMPEVYSYVSGFDSQTGVFVNDSVVIIPLDLFLGDGFEVYKKLGIPAYVQRNMIPEDIAPEVVKQILGFYFWSDKSQKPLIDQMIQAGKLQALLGFVLPGYKPWQLIGYTQPQYAWCETNEASIWAMMIEKQMLFSSDPMVLRNIMSDGPFTPGLDKSSPARIGEWIGLQIVKSYLGRHPETVPAQLFKVAEGQDFLRDSGYKPHAK